MKTINLKKYYYPLFATDTLIEVSDEVAEALLLMRREENNRTHKIWYHKAYYSLDCEDGIENCAFDFTAKSPEEILLEQEEEQLFLATLEHLSEAMNSLTDIQARRIHARYMLGKKLIEIAAEGYQILWVRLFSSLRINSRASATSSDTSINVSVTKSG